MIINNIIMNTERAYCISKDYYKIEMSKIEKLNKKK